MSHPSCIDAPFFHELRCTPCRQDTNLSMMKSILSVPRPLKDASFTLSWTSGYLVELSMREIFRRILTFTSGVYTRLQNKEKFQLFCELRLRRSRQYSPHLLRCFSGTFDHSGIQRMRPSVLVIVVSRNGSHFSFSHVSVSRT